MNEDPHHSESTDLSGAAIEDEIGGLSSELERQPPGNEKAAPPKPRRRILDSPWLAGILLVVAAAMTAANVAGILIFNKGERFADWPDNQLRETMLFAVEEVGAFLEDEGRLPRDLDDLGMGADSGLTYRLTGAEEYTLTASDGEESLTFVSTQDPETFFGELWSGL